VIVKSRNHQLHSGHAPLTTTDPHTPTPSEGTTLALAGCLDLETLNIEHTKIIQPIAFNIQRSFVQGLSGDALTEDAYAMEGNKTKSAFFQFIALDANAPGLQHWVASKPWLATIEEDSGRIPVQVASPECRKIIGKKLYFLGRYRLDQRDPLQRSKTCVVRLATDFGISDSPGVVLKLMRNRGEFEMELLNRRGMLDLGCVIAVRGFHVPEEPAELDATGGAEEEKGGDLSPSSGPPGVDLGHNPELLSLQRPERRAADDPIDTEYPYVLVMDRAAQSLHGFLMTQRVAGNNAESVVRLFSLVAEKVAELHKLVKLLHFDIKPRNILLMADGSVVLCDLVRGSG
jgi:hypothetical protein